MKQLAGCLVNKLLAKRNTDIPAERARAGALEGWISLFGNLILALAKFLFGLLTGSIALLADAAHTASDISSSLVILFSFKISASKPDREHPFGHGRIEYLAGLAIAVLLILAGISFAYTAFLRFMEGAAVHPSLPALSVIVFSILFKNLMYHFSLQLGKRIDSDAVRGSAWHHLSDSLSSVAVLVALAGSYIGLEVLDAVFGFAVAVLVVYTGVKIGRKSVNRILGAAPCKAVQKEMINCALAVEGVISAHDLEIHDYGFQKSVTLHIEVDGELNLVDAHTIAYRVERVISGSFNCSTVVHLDPCIAGDTAGGRQDRQKQ
jgi:cation diffusion facilitator family transporter